MELYAAVGFRPREHCKGQCPIETQVLSAAEANGIDANL